MDLSVSCICVRPCHIPQFLDQLGATVGWLKDTEKKDSRVVRGMPGKWIQE